MGQPRRPISFHRHSSHGRYQSISICFGYDSGLAATQIFRRRRRRGAYHPCRRAAGDAAAAVKPADQSDRTGARCPVVSPQGARRRAEHVRSGPTRPKPPDPCQCRSRSPADPAHRQRRARPDLCRHCAHRPVSSPRPTRHPLVPGGIPDGLSHLRNFSSITASFVV